RTRLVHLRLRATPAVCPLSLHDALPISLIRGLLGLKKPSGGKLLLGDGLKSTQIGYVPQQDAVQKDSPASVYEVTLSGCLNARGDRKSTRLNSSHVSISYAVFCLKQKIW